MRSIRKLIAILFFMLFTCSAVFGQVVISQVYGGGGNSGATYTNDFIELFNSGTLPVSVNGWSVQYASATGTTWHTTALSGTIQPGQYYLIQEAAGAGGTTPLPTPDATGSIAMSLSSGKVALVNTTTVLSGSCPTGVVDFVGYGSSANCYEGSGPTPTISNTISALRVNAGCTDTGDNTADFTTSAPNPRNTASPFHTCSVPAIATKLFFSEYIEGSSYNKALEIYNGTGAAVNLSAGGYSIQMFFNGHTYPGLTINLTGNVANGDVYVVAQSNADATILAQADQTNGAGWFNGNDAVVLLKGTTILDAIGQVGNDPGEWGTGLTSTKNNTLRRNSSICSGDLDAYDIFDPAMEWDGFAEDTFDGLGSHFANCTGSTYDIYVVDSHSGNSERVTFIGDADEYNPSFSNDGKLVAHDVVSGSDPLGQSIYITDLKTHTSTPLAGAEGGNDASWSPNGEYIAFDHSGNIYVVPSGGGTATPVRENAIDAEWSNNSKRLAFTDITDGSLRTVDLNGGSETILGVYGGNASWSPEGKYIAYSDGNNIFTIPVNEAGEPQGSSVQLTSSGSGEFSQQPSWSNDGKTIVFHSNHETGDVDIWTIPLSGGEPTLLAGISDRGDYDPCYSKNGKYVAYAGFTTLVFSKRNSNNEEQVSSNKNSLPDKFVLDQNFPNPFNPTTQIRFGIPEAGNVTLKIYNSVGQLVKTLVDGNMSEGYHQVTWDATDNSGSKLSSGVYFYRITAGTFTQVNKMLLLK